MSAPFLSKPEHRRVCVVGSLNMDLVVRAPRFPAAGETILGGQFATFPGGKGANQAVAAARMGAQVSMIGRVGDDAYGVELRRVLEAEGIDTSAVLTTLGTPTGVAVITVAEGGGNTIVVAPGANAKLAPEDVEAAREKIEGADVVLMQLEVPIETIEHAARIARSYGRQVILNAAPAMTLSAKLLHSLTLLIVNETEGALVSTGAAPSSLTVSRGTVHRLGEDSPDPPMPEEDAATDEMLGRLATLGPEGVIVTFGEAGSAWIHGDGCAMMGACPVNAVDTVGAGDAFCGAIAATWPAVIPPPSSSERTLSHVREIMRDGLQSDAAKSFRDEIQGRSGPFFSLELASAAGALATTAPGAIPSLPHLAQVRAFLRSLQR